MTWGSDPHYLWRKVVVTVWIFSVGHKFENHLPTLLPHTSEMQLKRHLVIKSVTRVRFYTHYQNSITVVDSVAEPEPSLSDRSWLGQIRLLFPYHLPRFWSVSEGVLRSRRFFLGGTGRPRSRSRLRLQAKKGTSMRFRIKTLNIFNLKLNY